MFINSLRKSPFSCSLGLILLGAFTLLSVPVYGQQIQQSERQVQQVPFLQFNFDEQGGETARNSGRGGSKYDARINGGTVEWGRVCSRERQDSVTKDTSSYRTESWHM
ncbi:hypothetical protein NXY01_05000 [Bacteroides fragilis]|nr:hypothetical protein NXY01_05000 [Bacteroides fragilis]